MASWSVTDSFTSDHIYADVQLTVYNTSQNVYDIIRVYCDI